MRTFTGTAGQKLTLHGHRQHASAAASTSTVRGPDGTFVAVAVRRRPDRVPRRVHAARHRHLHRHRSTPALSRPAPLTFLLSPVADNTGHDRDRHADDGHDDDHRRERRAHLHRHRRPAAHARGLGQHVQRRRRPHRPRTQRHLRRRRCSSTDPTGFRDVFTLPVDRHLHVIDRPPRPADRQPDVPARPTRAAAAARCAERRPRRHVATVRRAPRRRRRRRATATSPASQPRPPTSRR